MELELPVTHFKAIQPIVVRMLSLNFYKVIWPLVLMITLPLLWLRYRDAAIIFDIAYFIDIIAGGRS